MAVFIFFSYVQMFIFTTIRFGNSVVTSEKPYFKNHCKKSKLNLTTIVWTFQALACLDLPVR